MKKNNAAAPATSEKASAPTTVEFYDAEGKAITSSTSKADAAFVSGLTGQDKKPTTAPTRVYPSTPTNSHLHGYKPTNAGTTYTPGAARTAPVTPFYPPKLEDSLPKWDSEKADPENNWIIVSAPDSHKNKDAKAVLNDRSMGVVFFTPKVFHELQYVVNRLADKTGECAMFVLLRQLSGNEQLHTRKPHFLAYDWFLPKQTASAGEVKLDVADSAKYFDYLLEKYPEEFPNRETLHRNLMHAHSHHRMNMCSWSGTDDTQQTTADELGFHSLYRMFFLFTIGHGLKCTRVQYAPDLSKKDYAIGLCYSEPEYVVGLTKARKKELDEQMDALVSKTTAYNYGGGSRHNYGGGGYHYTPGVKNTAGVTHIHGGATQTKREFTQQHFGDFYEDNYAGIWNQFEDEDFDKEAMPGKKPEAVGAGVKDPKSAVALPEGNTKQDVEDTAGGEFITLSGLRGNSNRKEVFELVPQEQHEVYRNTLTSILKLLADQLELHHKDAMDEPEGIDFQAAVNYVFTRTDLEDSIQDVAAVPYGLKPIITKIERIISDSCVRLAYSNLEEEGLLFQMAALDDGSGEDYTMDLKLAEADLRRDAAVSAAGALELIGSFLGEAASLMSMGTALSDSLLEQLYNEGYLENAISREDLDTIIDGLAGNDPESFLMLILNSAM